MGHHNWILEPGRGWGPLQLGIDRAAIVERLYGADIEFQLDETNPDWLVIPDTGAELLFTRDDNAVLWQIACNDEELQVDGIPIIGQRLSQSLLAFRVQQYTDTFWSLDDEPGEDDLENPAESGHSAAGVAAEEWVMRGVLWVRSLGIGLLMEDGLVRRVFLRSPPQVPRSGCGPLTEQQLELAISEDLRPRLAAWARSQGSWSPLRKYATLVLLLAVGFTLVAGARYQRRWHAAPRATGTVIAVEKEGQREGLPVYVVEYKDPRGTSHQVRWTQADVHADQQVGDTVEVPYLEEAPDRPLGPARIHDVGVVHYLPYTFAAVILYVAVLFLDQRRNSRRSG